MGKQELWMSNEVKKKVEEGIIAIDDLWISSLKCPKCGYEWLEGYEQEEMDLAKLEKWFVQSPCPKCGYMLTTKPYQIHQSLSKGR